jgi:hypothetical protein
MSSGAGRGGGASQPSYLGMPKAAPLEGMHGRPTPRKRIQMTFHPSARNHTQICSEGGAQVNPWSAQARPQVLIGRSRIPHEAGCSHRRIMVDVLGRIDGWWKRSSTEM